MEKTLVHLFHSLPRQDRSLQDKDTGQGLAQPALAGEVKWLELCDRD